MNELVPQQRRQDDQVMEIDLLDLLAYYMSKLPWLIGALIVGALVAGLYTHFMIPDRFTATSRMYMVSASSDSVLNLSDLNLGTSISNDYVELMDPTDDDPDKHRSLPNTRDRKQHTDP